MPVTGGRRLRTLRGTLDEMIAEGEQAGDAYLRVVLAEPGRAGLGDLVREKLPNALEVMLDDEHRPRPGTRGGDKPSRVGRSPLELFSDYLGEQNIEDPRIPRMFAELLDEVTGAPDDSPGRRACRPQGGVMRPVRLLLDGFGSYRQPAEADFSDVDFFALVGPTGSGKSTLIDGLCFALYGTVPRWGKENAIADALAPAANACRVCLVFEAAGKRYAAVRALTRDKKGLVHTKEARLELLDPAIPPGAPIADLLAASIEQIAEGPDLVTARVEDLLGLSYRHFTQSVLLPQGRFSEFLHAKAGARQDLLVQLLAFGVYEKVGQRARERAKLAAEHMRNAQRERGELGAATEEAETFAAARFEALTSLARIVDDKLAAVAQLKEQAEQAAQQARTVREETGLLAALQTPAEVPGLAQRIAEADDLITERRKRRDDAEQLEADAERARDALPDKTRMETFRTAHEQRRELTAQLKQQEQELAARQAEENTQAEQLQAAERNHERVRDALASAERAHAAIALAEDLHVGDDCPVCLQPVASLPHHPVPADLDEARAAVTAAADGAQRSTDCSRKVCYRHRSGQQGGRGHYSSSWTRSRPPWPMPRAKPMSPSHWRRSLRRTRGSARRTKTRQSGERTWPQRTKAARPWPERNRRRGPSCINPAIPWSPSAPRQSKTPAWPQPGKR